MEERSFRRNLLGKRWRRLISTTSSQRRAIFFDVLRIVPIRSETIAPSLCHQGRVPDLGQHAAFKFAIRGIVLFFRCYSPFVGAYYTTMPPCIKEERMPISTQPLLKPAEKRSQPPLHHYEFIGKEEVEGTRRMVRLTVTLPSDLVEQIRDAVYWTPGVTLAWVIGRALRSGLVELVTANHGPFPKRSKPLRAGRPKLLGQSMALAPLPPHRIAVQAATTSRDPITPR